MENNQPKTDESVRGVLKMKGAKPEIAKEGNIPVDKEIDADDLVHVRTDENPDVTNETDLDELVHLQPADAINTNQEADVDDLMHEPDSGDEPR